MVGCWGAAAGSLEPHLGGLISCGFIALVALRNQFQPSWEFNCSLSLSLLTIVQ